MRVLVRERGVDLTEDRRAQIERTLGFALDRFWPRITGVTVGVADLNGPRGGVDKRCRVEVALKRSGTVFIEAVDRDVLAAVHTAAARTGRTVARRLKRDR